MDLGAISSESSTSSHDSSGWMSEQSHMVDKEGHTFKEKVGLCQYLCPQLTFSCLYNKVYWIYESRWKVI